MTMRSPRSHYELLDIAQDAKRETIALAYQRALEAMARRHDPDPNLRAALRTAFEVLTDPVTRLSYDLTVRSYNPARRSSAPDDGDSAIGRVWRNRWVDALVAGLILVGILTWMKSGKSSNSTPPPSAAQNTMARSDASSGAERERRGGNPSTSKPDSEPVAATKSATGVAGARSAEDIFSQVSVSVVRINVANAAGTQVAIGSGIVTGPATVITNCHVALRGDTLEVKVGGTAYSATVEVADEERDLCRLSVSGLTAPAVTIGSVESLRVGQRVFAIGAPQGLDLTISDGIVSALREVSGGKMIQTSAPVSPGSSGGGLFDTSGRLVGVVTFQNRVGQNLNFAVPADWVSEIGSR